MSKLLDNHIAVSTHNQGCVYSKPSHRVAIKRNKVLFTEQALTKIRIFDAHKNDKNEALEALNGGLINGDATLNGENGEMVKMRRWMISTCNRRKNKTGARVKKKEGREEGREEGL